MKKIYLTKEGYEKLVNELESLKNVKRKEIVSALEHARSLGDLRENAEYSAAKEALSMNEKRVNELEDKLARVEILDDAKVASDDCAYVGATITLVDLDTNEEFDYKLVDAEESNPVEGLISLASPVGKSLLGHVIGDMIEITVPAGVLKYKIINITRR